MNLGTFGFGSGSGGGSNTITGAGTVPKIPKFTAANVIGDSQISDDGTTVFIGASATSVKAAFEVNSTTKGVFLPRVTTAQQTAIGAGATDTSLLMFNTTNNRYEFYNHTDTSYKRLLIPEDVGNIIVSSTVTPSSHTGNLLETVIGYLEIPAGSFTNGDFLNFLSIAQVDTDSCVNKFYINTSPLLDGSQQQLLIYNQTNSVNIKLFADFLIYNNTLIGWKPATTNSAAVYGNVTGAPPSLAVDFTVTQYLIYTIQLAIDTKIFTLKGMYIERKRATI